MVFHDGFQSNQIAGYIGKTPLKYIFHLFREMPLKYEVHHDIMHNINKLHSANR